MPVSGSTLIAADGARGDARGGGSGSPPKQAWQVTRGHAALSLAELQQLAKRKDPQREGQQQQRLAGALRCPSAAEPRGGRFEHRHAAQQQVISEQRRLLREQQEVIAQLQEARSMAELRRRASDAQTRPAAQSPAGPRRPITQLDGSKESHTSLKGSSEPMAELADSR